MKKTIYYYKLINELKYAAIEDFYSYAKGSPG